MTILKEQVVRVLRQAFLDGAKDCAYEERDFEDRAQFIIDRVLEDARYVHLEERVANLEKKLNREIYPIDGSLTYCSSSKFKVDSDGTLTRES